MYRLQVCYPNTWGNRVIAEKVGTCGGWKLTGAGLLVRNTNNGGTTGKMSKK
jgi:hypothetical protein